MIGRGQYDHSAAIRAILAADRRGRRRPAGGTRGSGSTLWLGDTHDARAHDGDPDDRPLACFTLGDVEAVADPEYARATPERVGSGEASEPRQQMAELSGHFGPQPP